MNPLKNTSAPQVLIDAGAPTDDTNSDGKKAADVACTCDDAVSNCPKDAILLLLSTTQITITIK